MKQKIKKTNATRIVEKYKKSYELVSYEVDEDNLGVEHVASSMGAKPSLLFKTLVTINEKHQLIIAVIAGNLELDLKALAKVSNSKKCQMIPMKDLLKYTGYIRGGCSPFGMKKLYPTYLDENAMSHKQIYVSAGQRGLQLLMAPQSIIDIVDAKVAKIALI